MSNAPRPIAICHEHPDWFRPLFVELERRGRPYVRIDARRRQYDTRASDGDYGLVFNRMSPSAHLRGAGHAIFYTLNYLRHLEELGARVVNGYQAFAVEISKARQLSLLESHWVRPTRAPASSIIPSRLLQPSRSCASRWW